MAPTLRDEVKARLPNRSPDQIRTELVELGYAEGEVNVALKRHAPEYLASQSNRDRHNGRLFGARQFLDRVGFGTAAPQFLNILFPQSGAGLFLLGFITSLRTVISLLFTSVLQEYARLHQASKNLISAAGVLFGLSFLLMAFAVKARSPGLFAAGMLLATIGIVTYGDLYSKFVQQTLRKEKMSSLLVKLGEYGVLLTMIAMLASGWLLDAFPETSDPLTILGISIVPIGYLIAFEITAFAFILSGYLLSFVREERDETKYSLWKFTKEHVTTLRQQFPTFFRHRYIALLLLATVITGLLEVLGHAYYGVFLYEKFKDEALGGFLNVALLYSLAILASFLGPWFTSRVQRSIGLSPTLVFGTLLMAILPFTLVYNAHIAAVAVALILGVLGSAIVGLAQGFIARKLMDEQTRKSYFQSTGILLAIPYLILLPLGAWLADATSLLVLFQVIGFGLILLVTPLYFLLVMMANKERL